MGRAFPVPLRAPVRSPFGACHRPADASSFRIEAPFAGASSAVPPPAVELLGRSAAMAELRAFAARAAEVDAPVLLTGETGTGKTLVARWIHARSRRSEAPFVAVNCAAIPDALFESELFGHRRGAFTGADRDRPGLFAEASGGTLLLDEVAELEPSRQAKLLTALEDGAVRPVGAARPEPVDVRIVAATSRDLPRAVREGTFRRDLYHRLALLTWTLPPLRERGEDALVLARRLLDRFGHRHGVADPRLTPAAAAFIRGHGWPGNIRELAHALEAALILGAGPEVDGNVLEAVVRRVGLAEEVAAAVPRRREG